MGELLIGFYIIDCSIIYIWVVQNRRKELGLKTFFDGIFIDNKKLKELLDTYGEYKKKME